MTSVMEIAEEIETRLLGRLRTLIVMNCLQGRQHTAQLIEVAKEDAMFRELTVEWELIRRFGKLMADAGLQPLLEPDGTVVHWFRPN